MSSKEKIPSIAQEPGSATGSGSASRPAAVPVLAVAVAVPAPAAAPTAPAPVAVPAPKLVPAHVAVPAPPSSSASAPAPTAVPVSAVEATGNGSLANQDSISRQEDVPKEVCVPVNPSVDKNEAITHTGPTNKDKSHEKEKTIESGQRKEIANIDAPKKTNRNAQAIVNHKKTKVTEDVQMKEVSSIAPPTFRMDIHPNAIHNRNTVSFFRELAVHENLPSTWVLHVHKRLTGTRHFDAYWFTKTGKKLRSKPEIMKFLTHLRDAKGDEEIAWTRLKKGHPFKSDLMSLDIGRPLAAMISELGPDTSSAKKTPKAKNKTKRVAKPKAAKAGKSSAKVARPTKAKRKKSEKKKSNQIPTVPVTNSARYQRLHKVKQIQMDKDRYRTAEAKSSGMSVMNFERKRSSKAARKFPVRPADPGVPAIAESKCS